MALVDRYQNFKFAPYQYREYPKWVKPLDAAGKPGEPVLVEDRDEERIVMKLAPTKKPETFTQSVEVQPVVPETVQEAHVPDASTISIDLNSLDQDQGALTQETSEEDQAADPEASGELIFLRKRATELGVTFSERWGVTKLRRAIQTAQDSGAA